MRIRDVIKLIEADGWRWARIKGSHRHFKHPFKVGLVTIAGRPDLDLHPKTLKSILKQAGIMEIVDDGLHDYHRKR
jgi:predicted RNA binding protein YcfA (HicA-like mRNA interferase family)